MTTNADLIAELRGFAGDTQSARASLMRDAADALEDAEQRAEDAWKAAEDHVLDADAVHVRLSAELREVNQERDNWKLSAEEAERAEQRAEKRAEEAERERDSAMASYKDYMTLHRKAAELSAVMEKARLIVDRVPDGFWVDEVYELDNILNSVTAPADALRELKAEAWQEGAYRVYNSTLDEAEWWWSDWASENPYRSES